MRYHGAVFPRPEGVTMRKILAFFALACLTPALAADDDWVARLNAWADEFQIPADILPRERDALLKLDALHLFQNDWSNRPKITYLPPEIGELRQLERLQLQNNSLAELPAEITNLRQLYFIGLDGNRFTDFPTVLFQLPQLSTVSLMDNPLTRLPPEIGEFQQLRSLNVSGCGLTDLPPGLFELRQLADLDLGFNQLDHLPPEIGNLQELLELRLHANPLTALPAEITRLNKLQLLLIDAPVKLTPAQKKFEKQVLSRYPSTP
jgi:hypothetical protein